MFWLFRLFRRGEQQPIRCGELLQREIPNVAKQSDASSWDTITDQLKYFIVRVSIKKKNGLCFNLDHIEKPVTTSNQLRKDALLFHSLNESLLKLVPRPIRGDVINVLYNLAD